MIDIKMLKQNKTRFIKSNKGDCWFFKEKKEPHREWYLEFMGLQNMENKRRGIENRPFSTWTEWNERDYNQNKLLAIACKVAPLFEFKEWNNEIWLQGLVKEEIWWIDKINFNLFKMYLMDKNDREEMKKRLIVLNLER